MREKVIDTNIILRYLLHDIKSLHQKAEKFFAKVEKGEVVGKISMLVLDETIWAFERFYDLERKDYMPKLLKLLAFKNIRIIEARKEIIIKILERMKKSKIDFTDFYLSEIATKETIFTFDADFKKLFRQSSNL